MNLRLSPKYGVNSALGACPQCHHENGEVVLLGKMPPVTEPWPGRWGVTRRVTEPDPEAPRFVISGLCADCKQVKDAGGAMLIEVRPGTQKAPERTGRLVGITREAFERIFNVPFAPVCFVEPDVFDRLVPPPPSTEPAS